MQEKRGKFIVLEGIDGCGKSSQMFNIAKFITNKSKYNHILVTREPYKSREIRQILRQDSDSYSQARKLAELFIQDRKEHIEEIILPALSKGVHVISDRYKLSTIAYQSVQGIPVQELIDAHKGMLIPDIIIIIDVPVEVAEKRMRKEIRNENKFEANTEFKDKLRQRYLEMPKVLNGEKIVVIDGTKTIEETGKEIIEILQNFFN